MEMKLLVASFLCLSLVLVDLSVAKKGKFSNPFKGFSKPKNPLGSKTKDSRSKPNQGNYPRQPLGYPQYPGRPGGLPSSGGYPHQPLGVPQYPGRPGGYPQYPAGSYPLYPGRYPAYPGGGSYPAHGFGGYGNYPGHYINHNPSNRILSPHYGGSFGYSGHGGGGGSPFSHSVHKMGFAPSEKSRGFGRSAVLAAGGGAMAGMALGYGLGRFPHPHFHFHSPEQQYFYNYYMYRKYGVKSTDSNDYSRDYRSTPPESFDSFMSSCLKRTDLLPGERQNTHTSPKTTTTTTTTASESTTATPPVTHITRNHTGSNSSASPTPKPGDQSEAGDPNKQPSGLLNNTKPNKDRDEDDTVNIVEIGYPALIQQMKVKRCTHLYIVYSEKHLKKSAANSGEGGLTPTQSGFFSLIRTSTPLLVLSAVLSLQT